MTYEYGKDPKDEWRWRLIADNKTVMAVSPKGYRYPGECRQAIELVKKSAIDAEVKQLDWFTSS